MNLIEKIKKIPGGITWRAERYWKEYILKLPLHTRRFFVLRTRALKEKRQLLTARGKYGHLYKKDDNPLVSVTIPTWNRGKLLTEKVLPRVLAQTYQNIEVVIVGDHCTDDTAERIAALNDTRIRFLNLDKRAEYPQDKHHRHMSAGAIPNTKAHSLARGLWLAHVDDDDVWELDHLESLLRFARGKDLEIAWGKMSYEYAPGEWDVQGSPEFKKYDIPHSTVMMRTYLRLYKPEPKTWKLEMGGDRHRLRRMYYSGVRGGFLDKIVTLGPLRPGTTKQWALAEDREVI
ncbi:MAG: glycosyltransferase family 2 protein [Candidatus Aminicenantes bacterium]|nr:glycosyltransferase family 2 protein [Candidatus Aminicenantes bacterium]